MDLRAQTAAFAQVVAGVPADRPVPACPGWLLRDLVGHIGQAPRWAAGVVRSGAPAPVPDPRDADPGPPAGWTDWLLAGADELLAAVEAADTPVWTLMGPRPARWWVRRLLADLVVHTADAAFTADRPFEVGDEQAADALSEFLDLLGLATVSSAGTVALRPSTGDGWLVTGQTWRPGPGAADVTLTGTAADLLLVFMRRLPLDRVKVEGDRVVAEEFLTYTV